MWPSPSWYLKLPIILFLSSFLIYFNLIFLIGNTCTEMVILNKLVDFIAIIIFSSKMLLHYTFMRKIIVCFCDKERKNLFIHLKTVSNVLSFALHVKVFLCSLLTVSRGVCHRQPRTQYLMRDIINWTKLFWIDVLSYKNKTSHYKDP